MRINIKLIRKYSNKFNNVCTQLPLNCQGIFGCLSKIPIERGLLSGKKQVNPPEKRLGVKVQTMLRIAEITSGSAISQQRPAGTCKDLLTKLRLKEAGGFWSGA
jgi:hypothetical protein